MQDSINFLSTLSSLDWWIFSGILFATFASIGYGNHLKNKSKKKEDSEESSLLDHLILGRQLTLPMFVATLVATWYGGIFGVTRIAFEKGIYNFITQGLFWYIAYLIFAFYIIDRIAIYRAVTLPDLLHKLFGPRSAKLGAIFNFFNVIPIAYVISMGLFIQQILGGWLGLNMFLGICVVMTYSLFGGFRAVVFSDIVQFFVMCAGVALVLIFSMTTFGGFSFILNAVPETHLSLTGGEPILSTLVWGFIALSTLVDPNFYQRCFAAQSPRIAKRGIIASTVIWFCFDICTTFGAMYARVIIPEADPANAYLTYAIQILPDGLRGFFLAGILATILSTLDSLLFIAGTTLSYDLVSEKWRGHVWLHRLGIVFVAFLSFIFALVFDGNIKSAWKTLGSYSAACLLIPVMYGYIFPKKITDNVFVAASLSGVVAITVWPMLKLTSPFDSIDPFYIGLFTTSIALFLPLKFGKFLRRKG